MFPTTPRALLGAALAALALPAAAGAATTYTVNPGDKIQPVVDNAHPGDTIVIKAGMYTESVTVSKGNLTFAGEPGTTVVNPSSATGTTPTFSFTATADGPDVMNGLFVANAQTTGPAIQAGNQGLALHDSTVLGTKGDAVDLGTGTSIVQRSSLISLAGAGLSVVIGTADAAETLTVDSSVLVGKQSISAGYTSPTVNGAAIGVSARHVTAIGDVVASGANAPVGGGITVGLTDSILRGKQTKTDDPLSGTAAINLTRTDAKDTADDVGGLFANPGKLNFHLRADAPVIGKGGLTSGESATDIDGQPRANSDGTSDLGADQFVDRTPVGALTASATSVKQNQTVTFDASASKDPDVGDAVVSYQWTFGDGQTATTTTPTITHAYAAKGSFPASVVVVDKEGKASAAQDSPSQTITVGDGISPTIKVNSPFNHQSVRAYRGKRRVPVLFFGTAADDTGVAKVFLAVRRAGSSHGVCRWFDGKRRLKRAACTFPQVFAASLADGRWHYRLPLRARLPKGQYLLYAASADANGNASALQTIKFRVR